MMPEDDPDIIFLSSSLNNMLVCGILKGIHLSLRSSNPEKDQEFTKNWEGHTDEESRRQSLYLESKLSAVTKFNTVEILDPKIFENLSLDEVRNLVNVVKNDRRRGPRSLSVHYSLAGKHNVSDHFNSSQMMNRSGSENFIKSVRLSDMDDNSMQVPDLSRKKVQFEPYFPT